MKKPNESVSPTDYAVMMREVLVRALDEAYVVNDRVDGEQIPHLINLLKTALDYLFYLEDNRRVIL